MLWTDKESLVLNEYEALLNQVEINYDWVTLASFKVLENDLKSSLGKMYLQGYYDAFGGENGFIQQN